MNTNVGRSSLIIASGTVISRILGFIKAMVLAMAIGQSASAAAAAFGLANQLPNNVYALVAGGVMSAVLVPQIVKASKAKDGGEAYVSKILTLGGTVFLLLTIVATIAAPWLVQLYATAQSNGSGPGFTGQGMALAVALAYWCMPQILFYAIYTLLGEIYNARGQFGPYTWAPIVNNIVSIAGLVAFIVLFGGEAVNRSVEVWTADRIALMGFVTTLGVAAQALVLIIFFRKTGMRFRLDFGWRGVGLRSTGKAAMWLFGIVIIGQIKGLAQSRVATMANPDTDANLFTMQNAWYIFSLPHSIIAVSIAIAYFTNMSHHAAKNDIAAIRTDLSAALRGVGLLTTISGFVLAVVAVPLARFFNPDAHTSLQTAWVLWAMLVCLVPYSMEYVIQRVFFALGDTRTAFFYAIFGLVVSLLLMWGVTFLPHQWVVAGAALAVSIANLISASVWLFLVRRKVGSYGLGHILRRHVQYLVTAAIAAAAGVGVLWLLGGFSATGFAVNRVPGAAISCVAIGLVMATVYFGLLWLMRVPEFTTNLQLVLRRFGRGKSNA